MNVKSWHIAFGALSLFVVLCFGMLYVSIPRQSETIAPTPTPVPSGGGGAEGVNCNTLSIDVSSVDYLAPGSAVGSSSCTVYPPGDEASFTLSEGTAKNVAAFGTYTLHCTKTNYYDTVKTVDIDTCGAHVYEIRLADIDTSRDSAYFNQDDGLVNSASDAMAVGASGCVTLDAKFNGQEDDGAWSNPQLPYSYVSYGGTEFTDANWDFDKWKLVIEGDECDAVTGELGQVTAEEVTFKCYGLKSINYDVVEGKLTACAANGQNPGAENFTQTWTDADWFIDADTNTVGQGGDDADGADVGGTDDTVTVYFG